jgi:hypothetical protein|tara:strand:- start:557 stop:922 length:366 start_codon:yes stop_codon:yes gene_type:complete
MTQKKLEKGSAWAKADTNGDNILSDAEINAEMAKLSREETRLRIQDDNAKRDMIRMLIWFQTICTTVVVAILIFPEFVPESRLDHLIPVSTTFILSQFGCISGFILGTTIEKVKANREPNK